MTPKQEEALRDYLQEAIVPLIEQVLVKKLGQAMTFAKKELAEQPARTLKELHQLSREVSAQQALDKKAENARELGLDYEPAQDSGVVTAGGFDPRTQRTWVGLTKEEIAEFDTWHDNREEEAGWCNPSEIVAYIEAKLRSKNT